MEKHAIRKIYFREVMPSEKLSVVHVTVMILEMNSGSIPLVVVLKTHDENTSDLFPGFVGRMKQHVLDSSVPAALLVYEKEEDDD